MSTITFDTLKFVKTVETSGIQAANELVTKTDLELTLQKELAPIKTEMRVMKWMNSLVLGGIIVLILKSFF